MVAGQQLSKQQMIVTWIKVGARGVRKRQMDLGAILEVELRGPTMDWVYRCIVP